MFIVFALTAWFFLSARNPSIRLSLRRLQQGLDRFFPNLVGRRGFHPSTVKLLLDLAVSAEASTLVLEPCALFLFSYLFWFRSVSFMRLKWMHFTLLPSSILEVKEVAHKAIGLSDAHATYLLRFFELTIRRTTSD